jgi:hypothetical protein
VEAVPPNSSFLKGRPNIRQRATLYHTYSWRRLGRNSWQDKVIFFVKR